MRSYILSLLFWPGRNERGGHCCPPAYETLCKTSYFLQKPSLPLVTTTQLVSFSKPFMPVSAPDAALMVSVFPLRVNSITSPLAVPSKDFGPSRFAISIAYFSPFLVMFRYVPSAPGQRPTRASTLALVAFAAGLPEGEVAGDTAGLADAAGLGDAGVLTSVGVVQAPNANAASARTVNRTDLLNLLMFICIGQSRLTDGVTDC